MELNQVTNEGGRSSCYVFLEGDNSRVDAGLVRPKASTIEVGGGAL